MATNYAAVDIKMWGDKELERSLAKLPMRSQLKAVTPALRLTIKKFIPLVTQAYSGFPVGVVSARTVLAMAAMKPVRRTTNFGFRGRRINYFMPLPTREELGIEPDDKYYYPMALEYGTPKMAAKAPIRRVVNAHQDSVLAETAKKIAKGIEKQWRKLNQEAGGS